MSRKTLLPRKSAGRFATLLRFEVRQALGSTTHGPGGLDSPVITPERPTAQGDTRR